MKLTWKTSLAVAFGGAAGALCRYILGVYFPLSTLLANVAGSFLLGIVTAYSMKDKMKDWIKTGIGTGFCGGFTTMSTFSKEAFEWLAGGNWLKGLLYIITSLVGSLLFCLLGFLIGTKRHEG
ncbi:CrcB protein [Anoxybacillus vitaminiphilus]|uniref:Fluoride-specific ion channel FluC n=1 Tax=Paranoxybacillus vitaminiphilus TaxID=581036 RepID=A0A327YPX0_9BACL|nr:CrcB family protein [Anoxybacillus vitaminiphilus]RAK23174.1 CrcB protein [Anoxybacillus vitaminiphilus]